MSEFHISEEEIERLLTEPIIEHEEVDPLLAQPPIIGDRFRFAGISLSKALAHPTLGPALEDFHDRLHWSKGEPPELGAEGIELFLLNHTFFHGGHPIVSMPLPVSPLASYGTKQCGFSTGNIGGLWRLAAFVPIYRLS